MKNYEKPLEPIEVSATYPVVQRGKFERLKGFRIMVTYSGFADVFFRKNFGAGVGILPTSRGCKIGYRTYDPNKNQLVVEYKFRDGLFLTDALVRANDFRATVQEIITEIAQEKSRVGFYQG